LFENTRGKWQLHETGLFGIKYSAVFINLRALLMECMALFSSDVGCCGKFSGEMAVVFDVM